LAGDDSMEGDVRWKDYAGGGELHQQGPATGRGLSVEEIACQHASPDQSLHERCTGSGLAEMDGDQNTRDNYVYNERLILEDTNFQVGINSNNILFILTLMYESNKRLPKSKKGLRLVRRKNRLRLAPTGTRGTFLGGWKS
jgi:hypothetical protein